MPTDPETHCFGPNGRVPNSRLPLLVHRRAVPGGEYTPSAIESMFRANGWLNNWHYPGIYDYAHFHSTTHEVLGIARGHDGRRAMTRSSGSCRCRSPTAIR